MPVVSLEEASKSRETFGLDELRAKQPRNRGAMCFALASPNEGTRVTVQSIDGDDVMATAHATGQQIFAPASTFALAA
ncbi:hypothetical protein CBOM_02948 [Ceraceosorus bombacis]|uniref:Uncharacterized protein n=1 Tax=Ceraceosorus bombacis TaxID=401625 RepID=A0A0P1BHA8_9BASI|nr:hypothetical protein CBOM_02948 [Ceraceosorus bombacis]